MTLIAAAGAAALYILPARWVIAWIPASSPVIVTDASGTLWDASAHLAVGAEGLRRSLPDPLKWRLAFDGGPQLVLAHPWLRGPLKLAPSWRGVRMSGQSLLLPASVLTTAHGMFNALDPGGDVLFSWPELILSTGVVSANGDARLLSAQWRNATSSLARIRPLGDYTLAVSQNTSGLITMTLRTDRGPWMMEGAGALSRPGRMQFDGKAWVDASAGGETHEALQGLLDAMDPKAGQNGHAIMKIR
jgi:general secretion pathway protein N